MVSAKVEYIHIPCPSNSIIKGIQGEACAKEGTYEGLFRPGSKYSKQGSPHTFTKTERDKLVKCTNHENLYSNEKQDLGFNATVSQ